MKKTLSYFLVLFMLVAFTSACIGPRVYVPGPGKIKVKKPPRVLLP
ncbi:MAG: hypothetical protein OEZ68_10790 [Gammaproteobacteria bacterium]|nr:hypothetical protein [Gammaproteobacteria bacterium]MDH5801279.1 hypothetical protein [Gammaproteobacteria bacterium]